MKLKKNGKWGLSGVIREDFSKEVEVRGMKSVSPSIQPRKYNLAKEFLWWPVPNCVTGFADFSVKASQILSAAAWGPSKTQ